MIIMIKWGLFRIRKRLKGAGKKKKKKFQVKKKYTNPANISNKKAPRLHQSIWNEYSSPDKISGARYSAVPQKLFVVFFLSFCFGCGIWSKFVDLLSPRGSILFSSESNNGTASCLLSPKSVRTRWPYSSSKQFSGFKSL